MRKLNSLRQLRERMGSNTHEPGPAEEAVGDGISGATDRWKQRLSRSTQCRGCARRTVEGLVEEARGQRRFSYALCLPERRPIRRLRRGTKYETVRGKPRTLWLRSAETPRARQWT